jgi:hypothetical protein
MKAYISSTNVIYPGDVKIVKASQRNLGQGHIKAWVYILTEEGEIIEEKFDFAFQNGAPKPELAREIIDINDSDIISYDDLANCIKELLKRYN